MIEAVIGFWAGLAFAAIITMRPLAARWNLCVVVCQGGPYIAVPKKIGGKWFACAVGGTRYDNSTTQLHADGSVTGPEFAHHWYRLRGMGGFGPAQSEKAVA